MHRLEYMAYNKSFEYAPSGPDSITRRFALGNTAAQLKR